MSLNLTQNKTEAEEGLESLFNIMFEESNDPMIILDENLDIIKSNRSCTYFIGYNKDSLIGQNITDYINIEKSDFYREIKNLKNTKLDKIHMQFVDFCHKGRDIVSGDLRINLFEISGKRFFLLSACSPPKEVLKERRGVSIGSILTTIMFLILIVVVANIEIYEEAKDMEVLNKIQNVSEAIEELGIKNQKE